MRNIPEERRTYLQRGGSMKPRKPTYHYCVRKRSPLVPKHKANQAALNLAVHTDYSQLRQLLGQNVAAVRQLPEPNTVMVVTHL
jgi:hypothetical protein